MCVRVARFVDCDKRTSVQFVFLQRLSEIFPATTGGAKLMCEELNIPFLGSLPLDPLIARYCDEGKDFISELPNSPAVKSLNEIVKSKEME